MEKRAADFKHLYVLEWAAKVSSHARCSINERKQRVPELLPCTADLQRLCTYQKQMMECMTKELDKDPSPHNWLNLAEQTLTKLTVFNKRRGGEASRILVSDFINRPEWHEGCMDEFQASLTPLEKHLCSRMKMVKVVGKMRRSVPVLLTADVVAAMNLLVKHRSTINIPEANPFLFARPYAGSLAHLQAWDCLHKIAQRASLKNAERMQSTKLRKYVATVSQVFSFGIQRLTGWLGI